MSVKSSIDSAGDATALHLVATPEAHLPILMSWFPTRRSCLEWGGPGFRFPFDATTFRSDMRYADVASYSLVGAGHGDELLGFGQFYLRAGRCHVARLAIAPDQRGRRLGGELITRLMHLGGKTLGVRGGSLFVLAGNASAIRLYERLGFVPGSDPQTSEPLDGILYMVLNPRSQ